MAGYSHCDVIKICASFIFQNSEILIVLWYNSNIRKWFLYQVEGGFSNTIHMRGYTLGDAFPLMMWYNSIVDEVFVYQVGKITRTNNVLMERGLCMSEREITSAKKVECLTRDEELLFEVIQIALEGDELSEDYKYLCKDDNFTKKFATYYEILKHTLLNSLDESSQIQVVQKLYSFSDSLENYVKRLEELEKIATDIDGVDKTYAVQAGRHL